MKTSLKLLIVLALALAAFGQVTTASAAEIFKWKGPGADAYFASWDGSGCVLTEVSLFSRQETFKNPPGKPSRGSFVFLTIYQYDYCTEQLLKEASGFSWVDESDLQIAKKLAGATVNATVGVYDWVSDTWFDVYVDLSWTAVGPASRQSSSYRVHEPGCKYHSRFKGTFRPAEVNGAVSDGSTNFTPETGWGNIFDSQGSDTYIGCGF